MAKQQTSVLWRQSFENLPLVQGPDHALSLGYKIYLCTSDKRVARRYRASPKAVEAFTEIGCSAMHVAWSQNRKVIIYVAPTDGGSPDGEIVPLTRIVGLLAHEISHLVDHMFEVAHVDVIDTELRAYYMDFLIEKFAAFWLSRKSKGG